MFAIANDTTAAEILKALGSTGLSLRCSAYKVKDKPALTVKAKEPFNALAFEDALMETRIPTLDQPLTEEELEAYAREYAEQEAASSLVFQFA